MTRKRLERTYVELREPLSWWDLRAIVRDPEVSIVQTSEPLRASTWSRLDAKLFARRPDIELRVYGFYGSVCDLAFARDLRHVRHFSADALQRAVNVEAIAGIPSLESLGIGIYDAESFEFLDEVSSDLSELYLGETRSKKPSLAPLRRFRNLRKLQLVRQHKQIEVLAELRSLESLILRSISTPDLSYLTGLPELWSLELKLGGIRDLAGLADLPALAYLELWQIRGLEDLSVLSRLSGLQNLALQSLSRVRALPSLIGCKTLRRVVLMNLRGLEDLSALEHAPALEDFALIEGKAQRPEQLEPVLRNPTLRRTAAGFGGEEPNRAFEAMRRAKGLAEFEWDAFDYNPARRR